MRVKPCISCTPADGGSGKFKTRRGFTRHADRICSWCRRYGAPNPTVNYLGRGA